MKNRNKAYGAEFTLLPWQTLFLMRIFNHRAKQTEINQNAVLTFNEETLGKTGPKGRFWSNLQVMGSCSTKEWNLWDVWRPWWMLPSPGIFSGLQTVPEQKVSHNSVKQGHFYFILLITCHTLLKAEGTTEHLTLYSPSMHDQGMQRFVPMSPKKGK